MPKNKKQNSLCLAERQDVELLYSQGAKITELAKQFKCGRGQIYNIIKKSPLFMGFTEDQITDMQQWRLDKMQEKTLESMTRVAEIQEESDAVILNKLKKANDEKDPTTVGVRDANQISKDAFTRSQILQDKPTQNIKATMGVIMFPHKEYSDDKPIKKDILETASEAS